MPTRTYIADIASHAGEEVTLSGWVYNKTGKGKLQFIMLRDGTGMIQAVIFKGNVSEKLFEECQKLTQESSIQVTGTVAEDNRGRFHKIAVNRPTFDDPRLLSGRRIGCGAEGDKERKCH